MWFLYSPPNFFPRLWPRGGGTNYETLKHSLNLYRHFQPCNLVWEPSYLRPRHKLVFLILTKGREHKLWDLEAQLEQIKLEFVPSLPTSYPVTGGGGRRNRPVFILWRTNCLWWAISWITTNYLGSWRFIKAIANFTLNKGDQYRRYVGKALSQV